MTTQNLNKLGTIAFLMDKIRITIYYPSFKEKNDYSNFEQFTK